MYLRELLQCLLSQSVDLLFIFPHSVVALSKFMALNIIYVLMAPKLILSVQCLVTFSPWISNRPFAVLNPSGFHISFPFIEHLGFKLGMIPTLPTPLILNSSIILSFPSSNMPRIQWLLTSSFPDLIFLLLMCLSSLSPTSIQCSWRQGLIFHYY